MRFVFLVCPLLLLPAIASALGVPTEATVPAGFDGAIVETAPGVPTGLLLDVADGCLGAKEASVVWVNDEAVKVPAGDAVSIDRLLPKGGKVRLACTATCKVGCSYRARLFDPTVTKSLVLGLAHSAPSLPAASKASSEIAAVLADHSARLLASAAIAQELAEALAAKGIGQQAVQLAAAIADAEALGDLESDLAARFEKLGAALGRIVPALELGGPALAVLPVARALDLTEAIAHVQTPGGVVPVALAKGAPIGVRIDRTLTLLSAGESQIATALLRRSHYQAQISGSYDEAINEQITALAVNPLQDSANIEFNVDLGDLDLAALDAGHG